MKKIIALFTVCFTICLFCLPCVAAESGKLTVKSATVLENENLVLEIAVENNPGIIGAGFEISYDTEVLSLAKTENGQIFSSIYVQSQNITDEPYRMLWMDVTTQSDQKTNGTLMTLTFKVLKKNRAATIKILPMAGNIFNYDLQDQDIAGCSFSLKVWEEALSSATTSSNTSSVPKVDSKVELKDFKQLPVTEKVQNSSLEQLKDNTSSTVSANGTQQAASQAAAALNSSNSVVAGSKGESSGEVASAVLASQASSSAAETMNNSGGLHVLYAVLAVSGVAVVVAVVILVLKKKNCFLKTEEKSSNNE